MQRMLWFPLYIDHFMASRKVLRMTVGEQGAYLRLLMFAWTDTECTLTSNLDELKELALWTEKTDGDFEKVRACFIRHPGKRGRIYNPRLKAEWEKVEDLKSRRKEAAQKRWEKPVNPAHIPLQSRPTLHDRESKGFTAVGSEISKIADKWLPPQ